MDKRLVWERCCGSNSVFLDFSGRKIRYSMYKNNKSLYGWDIIKIDPNIKDEDSKVCNYIVCHYETLFEKGNDFPFFEANNKSFKANKTVHGCYEIKELK